MKFWKKGALWAPAPATHRARQPRATLASHGDGTIVPPAHPAYSSFLRSHKGDHLSAGGSKAPHTLHFRVGKHWTTCVCHRQALAFSPQGIFSFPFVHCRNRGPEGPTELDPGPQPVHSELTFSFS